MNRSHLQRRAFAGAPRSHRLLWLPIACLLFFFGELGCAHLPDLEPGASAVSVTSEAAPTNVGELATVQVTHGLGRPRGSREGALVLLKNAATELGAIQVHITHEEPKPELGAYRIEALAVMPVPLTEQDFSSDLLQCRQDKYGRRCTSQLRQGAGQR